MEHTNEDEDLENEGNTSDRILKEKLIKPEERKAQSAQIEKSPDNDVPNEGLPAWGEPDATEFEKHAAASELEPEVASRKCRGAGAYTMTQFECTFMK